MKRPPRGQKDLLDRQKAGNKVLMPISIVLFITIFFSPSNILIRSLGAGLSGFFIYFIVKWLRNYKEEIHGKALKEFNKLYTELWACASAEDFVGITRVIEAMAKLMETDFNIAYRHLWKNSFTFGKPLLFPAGIEAFTFLLGNVDALKDVWVVLNMDAEHLPEVLTSPYDYLRYAAMTRMSQLQKEGR